MCIRDRCGIEKAGFEQDAEAMKRAIQKDVMLHAYMFMQSGIPVLYSGDEIGQVNDYTYKEDPNKAADSRYIHRGAMNWDLARNISDPDTVEGQVFTKLGQLEKIRKSEKVFVSNARILGRLKHGKPECFVLAGILRVRS